MTSLAKITKPFFSMMTTGALLVIFLTSIAYATFIENGYGTATARILIYNARWFEILLMLTAINLIGSIFYNKLITKKKWGVLLFHTAFLIILAGAAITRFTGFEGSIHIRDGEQSNQMVTEATCLTIMAENSCKPLVFQEQVRFSPYTANHFKKNFTIDNQKITVENLRFVPSATESAVGDPAGEPIVALLAVDRYSQRFDFLLKRNETRIISGNRFGFLTSPDSGGIRITNQDGQLFFESPDTVFVSGMDQNEIEKLVPGMPHPLSGKTIYQTGTVGFVLKQYLQKGKPQLVYIPSQTGTDLNDALDLKVTSGNESREMFVYGKQGVTGKPVTADIGNIRVSVAYGSTMQSLPFSLKLNDFNIERYPGSDSPSSYASEVTLIDTRNHVEKPFRIFMNNILKYKGYRFFQSSFDQDEKGTVLSVTYDAPGTTVTYIGYFLMALGMILTLFSRKSRFHKLVMASTRLSKEREKLFAVILFLVILFSGMMVSARNNRQEVSLSHARKFGTLLVQNNEGRIEPVNTLFSEVLRKVAKKGSFKGLEPLQVMLEILTDPEKWKTIPLIKVADPELRKILDATGGYVPFRNVLENDNPGTYRLRKWIEKAYGKKPADRNRFDKEVINVDERVNILYKIMTGGFLTIFPIPEDKSHKWVSLQEAETSGVPAVSEFAKITFSNYIKSLQIARQTGNYEEADKYLNLLKENQKKYGAEIIPPMIKTKLEIFYINFNIFSKLGRVYIFLGIILLAFQFILLLRVKSRLKISAKVTFWIVFVVFMIHSAGLCIRWYISGHAPWSNGYETLLYISWATCLAGLIFSKKSPMTLAVTTLLSAISLFVAGMSWMSPELTNLVPVLKSYWLVIHVAVITASYGFFAVAALLGLINLILFILQPAVKNERIGFTIKELVLIIEIAMIIGLFMVTIGSFLGGVWANESWGRYWGWDPKETWALVTILVYAFIIHSHKISGFRGPYAVSLGSVTGFCSVLMTFFGVNYYLSGMHSYAQGEPMPVSAGVYIGAVAVIILSSVAYWSYRHQLIQEKPVSGEKDI